jgi:hypothetical protein
MSLDKFEIIKFLFMKKIATRNDVAIFVKQEFGIELEKFTSSDPSSL